MKQHITLKQWNELTKKQFLKLWNNNIKDYWELDIGKMIEFLGDDLECMSKDKIEDDWLIEIRYHSFAERTEWEQKELIDSLWEAVKYKLKK